MRHINHHTYTIIFLLFLSILNGNEIKAEPSKNMRFLINDSVSVIDFLCYRLKEDLQEEYKYPSYRSIFSVLQEMAKKIGDKELISLLLNFEKFDKQEYVSVFQAEVYLDYESNRLNIEIITDTFDNVKEKKIERLLEYWESIPILGKSAYSISRMQAKGYNVGKFEGELWKAPRYEGLRSFIYNKINEFDFHHGYSIKSYDENVAKKELIERLKIRIILIDYGYLGGLHREFYDGSWKKTNLSSENEKKLNKMRQQK